MTEEKVSVPGAQGVVYRQPPQWGRRRTAAIGQFQCSDAQSGTALLERCCADLSREGFEALIGPLDGDTWHAYRLTTFSDGSPAFFLEPDLTPHHLTAFEEAGFSIISKYISSRGALADAIRGEPAQVQAVRLENWDGKDPEGLVNEVFDVSLQAFRNNPFYQPVERSVFQDMYRPVMSLLDRDLVFAARRSDGAMVGFLFAIPDLAQGASPSAVIAKTYASLLPGVGRVLLDTLHTVAQAQGYQEVIHALMHETNASYDRSQKYGTRVFRRYALMGRELAGS